MSITENLFRIKSALPPHVTLVAVSKTKPVAALTEAYDAGQRIFGENRIQEMNEKFELMPKDVEWHMIGHIQTNKIKYMAPFVNLVHGVDSLKVLAELDNQAFKNNRIIDCLLQIHIAEEETKFGFSEVELDAILSNDEIKQFKNIKVKGLMGMATFTENKEQIKKEFLNLKSIYDRFSKDQEFQILSMGMSGDYHLAIDCGSTMIRIGSSIFGDR
ncbi:MAG TPA: YggS family pyridoxal phosphate-dependent enzyme [Flavobacterium sp.]|jgi:hypothetical protein